MKSRTLLIAISLFTMAPAVFGMGMDTTLRGTKGSARECSLRAARHIPSEVQAAADRNEPARGGSRMTYGASSANASN